MKRTTVTSSKTGQSITLPVKYTNGQTQIALNTLVSVAYNTHPVAVAVTRSLQIEKV